MATALIRHLAWEPLYAVGAALKRPKKFLIKKKKSGVPVVAVEMNLTRNQEVVVSIPDLAHWVKDPVLQ